MQDSDERDWPADLAAGGERQREALDSLREILLNRMRRTIGTNKKGGEAFVEDVVQEGLMAVLDSLKQFEGRSRFTTWATTITIHIAYAEMRRARWKDVSLEQLLSGDDSAPPAAEDTGGAEAALQRSEIITAMHRVIQQRLTEKQRTALLAELQGMPLQEIASRIDSSRNAVYKLTHDARKSLKQGLLDAGYSHEDLDLLQRRSP